MYMKYCIAHGVKLSTDGGEEWKSLFLSLSFKILFSPVCFLYLFKCFLFQLIVTNFPYPILTVYAVRSQYIITVIRLD